MKQRVTFVNPFLFIFNIAFHVKHFVPCLFHVKHFVP
nr:MAG TPA_asm: hypothetical protein [Caudoviricetes sp.]